MFVFIAVNLLLIPLCLLSHPHVGDVVQALRRSRHPRAASARPRSC